MGERTSRALLLVGLVAATAVVPVTALWNGGSGLSVLGVGSLNGGRAGGWWRDVLAVLPMAGAVLALHRRPGAWPVVVAVGVLCGAATAALLHGDPAHVLTVLVLGHASLLSLFGALAGAQSLVREPSEPLDGGPGVAGTALGAPALAAAVLATLHVLPGGGTAVRDTVFVALAVVGAIAVLVCSRGRVPEGRPPLAVTVAGVLAALAPSVLSRVSVYRIGPVLGVSADVLNRRPYVGVALLGLVVIAVALVLAVVAGLRVLAAVSIAAAAAVGLGPTLFLCVFTMTGHGPARVVVLGVLAVGAGVVLGTLRWRSQIGAFACIATASGLVLAVAATDGDVDKLVGRTAGAGTVLLAVALLAVTTTASAVAPLTTRRRALPVALGVLLPLLVAGGGYATAGVRTDGEPSRVFTSTDLLLAAGLLAAAGVALLVLVAVEVAVSYGRARPLPTATPT